MGRMLWPGVAGERGGIRQGLLEAYCGRALSTGKLQLVKILLRVRLHVSVRRQLWERDQENRPTASITCHTGSSLKSAAERIP